MFSNTAYTFSDGTTSTVVPSEIVGRTYGFMPWGGRIRRDWAEMTNQQNNFSSFIVGMTKDQFVSGHTLGNDAAMRRLLTFFEQRRESIAQLMWYANELMTKMAISPLCMPEDRDEAIEDGMFTNTIEGGMVTSLLTILIPETFNVKPPTMDLITAGRGISLSMKRFIEEYFLMKDIMPKESFFKSEIIERAFMAMPDGPIKRSMNTIILGAPEKHHFIFPERALLGDLANASRQYALRVMARDIVAQYPEDFGYAPFFYYVPRPFRQAGENVPEKPDVLYEYYITPGEVEIEHTFSFSELLESISKLEYTPILRTAYNSGKAIKFEFPIKFTMTESAPDDNMEKPPFNQLLASASRMSDMLRLSKITVYYQWSEEYTDERLNTEASSRPPVYQVPMGSIDFDIFAKFVALPRKVITYRSGVEDLSMNEFISLVRRSDV
jgi:hypothetical protein